MLRARCLVSYGDFVAGQVYKILTAEMEANDGKWILDPLPKVTGAPVPVKAE